jgi:hypothetical protein
LALSAESISSAEAFAVPGYAMPSVGASLSYSDKRYATRRASIIVTGSVVANGIDMRAAWTKMQRGHGIILEPDGKIVILDKREVFKP